MPTAVLHNKTPFEILHRTTPSYSHLKAFCFASTLKRGRDKLQSRAQLYVFIGYPYGRKAYKLLNLETKRVFASRDVKFHENIFPYHHITHKSDTPLPNITQFIASDILFQDSNLNHFPDRSNSSSFPHPSSPNNNIHYSPSNNNISSSSSSDNSTTSPTSHNDLSHGSTEVIPEDPQRSYPDRRSTRPHNPPKHLNDFFCGLVQSHNLPIEHHALVSTLFQYQEPGRMKRLSRVQSGLRP